MKDLTVKIDTMFALMDQRDERLLAIIDQRDSKMTGRVTILEDSLLNISKCLEALEVPKPSITVEPDASLRLDFADENSPIDIEASGKLHPLQNRAVRVDFPLFEGDEVLNWIFRAEQFFTYYRISDPYRLELASIHLDGPVVSWYQMLIKTGTVSCWADLVTALEEDYGPTDYESPEYSLFRLTQEDSVTAYYHKFTALANRVEGVCSKALIACFIGGLKEDIQ